MMDIIDLNNAGYSVRSIATLLRRPRAEISRHLRQAGVDLSKRGGAPRRYTLNEQIFQAPSEERNYWLGFLIADGCITNNYHLVLDLKASDRSHVEKFRRFVGSTHPLYENGKSVRFHVSSHQMVDDLSTFGVTPAKSSTANVHPSLRRDPDFWRGIVDGDGWIGGTPSAARLELVGSENVCKHFSDFVFIVTGRTPSVYTHKSIFRVRLASNQTKQILTAIYHDPVVSLNRKHERVRTILGDSG